VPYEDTEDTIKKLIGDITLEMSAEDYNPLPDLIINDVEIEMPDNLRASYDRLEKEFFLVLDSGKEIEVFNQAALTNKCLQFSNGAMYPIAGMPLWEPVHDMKLDALEEIIDEAQRLTDPVRLRLPQRRRADHDAVQGPATDQPDRVQERGVDQRDAPLEDWRLSTDDRPPGQHGSRHRWFTGQRAHPCVVRAELVAGPVRAVQRQGAPPRTGCPCYMPSSLDAKHP
jgi:hypothetical protein